jgi:riboflavin kinase
MSQQSISRKLREMEGHGLVKRVASPNGLIVSLDEKGRNILQSNYKELSVVFSGGCKEINGSVEKGIGEGAYYVSQVGYQKDFKSKIGFKAYAGTLNLRIDKEELLQFLANKELILIEGFNTKTRSFGALSCYKVKVDGVNAAIVKAERSRHAEDIIEVIAAVNLRDKLNLKDNDQVKIS